MSCSEIRKPDVITTHAPGGKLRLVGGDARNALICISVSAQLLLVIKVAASPEINIPENNSVLSKLEPAQWINILLFYGLLFYLLIRRFASELYGTCFNRT